MSRTLLGRFRDAMKIMLMAFKGLGFGASGGFGKIIVLWLHGDCIQTQYIDNTPKEP